MSQEYGSMRQMPVSSAALMLASVCLCAEAPSERATGARLVHDEAAGRVEVHLGGEHFTTYHYNRDVRPPFLWPVHTEGGVGVTRNFPMGKDEPASNDHPHHYSLWLVYGDVNGHDFWHGRAGERVETVRVETGEGEGRVWIRAHNTWRGRGGAPVLDELMELRFHAASAAARFIDMTVTFTAAHGDATFGDSKEGMLAFRIRPEIEGRKSGLLTSASGKRGERDAYGAPSRWMDYSGPIKGHGQRGIALFDHPGNTLPGYWHVRDYGLAAINPFGRRAVGGLAEGGGHTLKKGEALTLRYRVYVHSGDGHEADVDGQYKRYAGE